MVENEKMTAHSLSVGADKEQSSLKIINHSIPEKQQNCNDLDTISMSELFDNVYTPRIPIIENLLYEGTYLFVGAPKVGKSFFMAQLGYSVGSGTDLWEYKVNQSGVLYLALEDNYARLQRRLSTMYKTDATPNFHMGIIAKKLGEGLREQLETYMLKNPKTKLIIIDTLKKIRDKEQEQYSYNGDYEIIEYLKGFADRHRICLLIVHHTRKQGADDTFDTISGSNGLLGAADGAFIMQKQKRVEGKATLDIVGRDQQDQKIHLQFNKTSCLWEFIKAENDIAPLPPDPLLENVASLLTEDMPTWMGTASELLPLLGDTDLQPNTLTRKLNTGVERLLNEYGIRYENNRTHFGKMIKLSLVKAE